MRASKLMTLSAAAILVGGTNLALAQSQQGSPSVQGSNQSQGSTYNRQGNAGGMKGGFYGRANPGEPGEAGAGMTLQRRAHRQMMQSIPRLSDIGNTQMRIDGQVAQNVLQSAGPLPEAVKRLRPRLRQDRAFIYGDQVAIVNPKTKRIVALIKAST